MSRGYCAVSVALSEFWNGFGVPAFIRDYVPKGQKKPYITYTFTYGNMFETSYEAAEVFTYSGDLTEIDILTNMISVKIPPEGIMIELRDIKGKIRLTRSTPFCMILPHEDNMIKAKSLRYGLTCYIGGE